MKDKKVIRTLTDIINIGLIFLGSMIMLAFSSENNGDMIVSVFAVVICSMSLAIFVIDFIAAFESAEATFHSTVIALFFLLFVLMSPDMCSFYVQLGFEPSTFVMDTLGYLSFAGMIISMSLFYRYTYRPKNGKRLHIISIIAVEVLAFIAYVILARFGLQHIVHMANIVAIVLWSVHLRIYTYRCDIDNLNFYATSIMTASAIGMQLINSLYYAHTVSSAEGWSIFYSWIIICCFCVIYFNTFLRYSKAALHLNEYKLQAERLKMKVLIGQIKPHFIFNSLTAVKSMYHSDTEEGDRALELFSDYLRESLAMIDSEVIPFEQELQNLSRYIDFINMSQEREFDVIYNIDVTDFSVPAFSLQPFIENAIKYSRVNEKADGCIIISTAYAENGIEVKITDNGVGFDTSRLKNGAHGIKNSCERFKLFLGIEPIVESQISVGTSIRIYIKD